MTPQEIFDAMPGQLDENAAKNMNATIQFNLSGDNGGQWYVTIKDGKAEVSKGTAPSANINDVDGGERLRRHDHGQAERPDGLHERQAPSIRDMGLAMKMQTLFRRPA